MYQWDEEKNRKNLAKQGVDFQEARTIFECVTDEVDAEHLYGEYRYTSIGLDARGRILCVIHTERNGDSRIISARRANPTEEENFLVRAGYAQSDTNSPN